MLAKMKDLRNQYDGSAIKEIPKEEDANSFGFLLCSKKQIAIELGTCGERDQGKGSNVTGDIFPIGTNQGD